MAGEGNGKRILKAEERLLKNIEPGSKTGDTVSKRPYKKKYGFMQGPNDSITVALTTLSVWTRLLETEVECKTHNQ